MGGGGGDQCSHHVVRVLLIGEALAQFSPSRLILVLLKVLPAGLRFRTFAFLALCNLVGYGRELLLYRQGG